MVCQENVLLKKDLEACQKGTAVNAEGIVYVMFGGTSLIQTPFGPKNVRS